MELEGAWQPNRTWQWDAAYGFTDARFLEFYDAVAGEDYAGKQVAKSPEHTVHLGVTRKQELANHMALSTRVEFEGMGKLYWDNGNTLAQDFYPLAHHVFVTLSKENWEWSLWGRNLLDETYDGYGFVDAAMGDRIFPGAPRMIGATVRVRY